MQSVRKGNLLFLLVSIIFLTSIVSANSWSINPVTEPFNRLDVSNDTSTVKLMELVDSDGDPVKQDKLEGDVGQLSHTYNVTDGFQGNMEWLHSGYYYTEFKPNTSEGDWIKYELDSDQSDYKEENLTEQLNYGNMTVNLSQDNKDMFSERIKFGKTVTINASVTDSWNETVEDNATVYAYFTNLSETESEINNRRVELGWNNGYYTNQMSIPDIDRSRFVFWVYAKSTDPTDMGYKNQFGSTGTVIETLPEIRGEIDYLNASSGCDQVEFFTQCEPETKIETGFEVTESSADQVNLSMLALERDSDEWNELNNITLEESDGIYSGEIRVPILNTSKYHKQFRLKYNASSTEREFIENYDVDYRTYRIQETGDLLTSPGKYTVNVEFTRYFTPTPLNSSHINGTIDINTPSGDNFAEFGVDEMEYDRNRGVMKKNIDIPFDGEKGVYEINISAMNQFGEWKQELEGFNVSDIQRTFNLSEDDFNIETHHRGIHEFNVTVENLFSSTKTLENVVENDFEDGIEVEVNNGSEIELESEERKNVTVALNVSEVQEDAGDIKFWDSEANFNETIEINLEAPDCSYDTGIDICVQNGFDSSADEKGYESRSSLVYYLSEDNTSMTLTPDAEGNITDILTIDPLSKELNETDRVVSVTANYSADRRGYFSGTIEMENISIPVSFDSDIEATELDFEVTSSIDLGTVPEGDSATSEIEISNTGSASIDTVSFVSTSMTVSADSLEVAVDESETVELEFTDVTESGSVTVTAGSAGKEETRTVSVDVDVVPDLYEQAEQLRTDLNDLQSQVTSDENQAKLDTASYNISEIQNEYNAGNYEEAQRMYDATSDQLDEVRYAVANSPDNTNESTDEQTQDGPIFLFIAIVVFILLIMGFILYTSYIPEEGDPLYGVLGQ